MNIRYPIYEGVYRILTYDNGKEEKRILIIGIFNISLYGHGDSRIHDFTVMRYNRETARQLMEINGSPSGT